MTDPIDNTAYTDRAGDYDAENEGKGRTQLRKLALLSAVIEQHAAGRPVRMLEVGCGTGIFTKLIAARFPNARITATDAFVPMLEIARIRLRDFTNVSVAQYDAETGSGFPEKFDIVYGIDLIHHLADPVAGLRNWRALTAPGGALVFFESNARNPVLYLRMMNRPEEARFKFNTRANLTSWLDAAGWREISVTYAPIHLPNGPPQIWRVAGRIEDALHPILAPLAGGMVLYATSG
jgi:ubiquinone/menaquinone biosynthesis C-methylase UbiE